MTGEKAFLVDIKPYGKCNVTFDDVMNARELFRSSCFRECLVSWWFDNKSYQHMSSVWSKSWDPPTKLQCDVIDINYNKVACQVIALNWWLLFVNFYKWDSCQMHDNQSW